MKNRKVLTWTIASILALLIIVSIATPNLLKSRIAANQASFIGRSRMEMLQADEATLVPAGFHPLPNKKLIRNGELALVVSDIHQAEARIQRLVETDHGEVDQLESFETGGANNSATMLIRVPSSGLGDVMEELKKLSIRTAREQISTRDVTQEYFDNAAHLKNMGAEEGQYLSIMKQAHTVKDTLEVSQKLSEVRDRIERLQAQINLMTRDVEMSQIKISLMQESEVAVFGWQWHPMNNAKIAASDLFQGASEWADWLIAVIIKLPLLLLWGATVIGILWAAWRLLRKIWRWFVPTPAAGAV